MPSLVASFIVGWVVGLTAAPSVRFTPCCFNHNSWVVGGDVAGCGTYWLPTNSKPIFSRYARISGISIDLPKELSAVRYATLGFAVPFQFAINQSAMEASSSV